MVAGTGLPPQTKSLKPKKNSLNFFDEFSAKFRLIFEFVVSKNMRKSCKMLGLGQRNPFI